MRFRIGHQASGALPVKPPSISNTEQRGSALPLAFTIRDESANDSLGGVLIETERPAPFGASVPVRLELPGETACTNPGARAAASCHPASGTPPLSILEREVEFVSHGVVCRGLFVLPEASTALKGREGG